jgi:integrase
MGLVQNISNHSFAVDAYEIPDMDSPVLFDKNGKIISYFKDDVWDFSNLILTNCNIRKIHFNLYSESVDEKLISKIKFQLKTIVYGLFYLDINSRKNNSISGVIQIINTNVIFLKNMCLKYNCDVEYFINSGYFYFELKDLFEQVSYNRVKGTIKLFKQIEAISKTYKIFSFNNPDYFDDFLKKYNSVKNENNQKLVIPIHILSEVIYGIDYHLNLFLKNISNIEKWVNFLKNDKKFADLPLSSNNKGVNSFLYSVKLCNLDEIVDFYKLKSKKSFLYYLRNVQKICLLKIISLTGMRFNEAYRLNFNCLQIVSTIGKSIYIINGKSSKSSGNNTSWISSFGVLNALEIAKSLTKLFYDQEYENKYINALDKFPLFPVLSMGKKKSVNQGVYNFRLIGMKYLNESLAQFDLNICVNEEDYIEAKQVNVFQDLVAHNIEVGKNWHFTYHQFRRSLVVYACRSGLVTLPALKQQMNHLTIDMTSYYGGNSHNTKNFIFEDNLLDEFRSENYKNQIDMFEKDVILCDSNLFGAEGQRLQLLKDKKLIPLIHEDRKQTLKSIKAGKFSYKTTPVGGCSRIGPCDKLPLSTMSECLLCSFAIFTNKSLPALSTVKKMLVNQLHVMNKTNAQYEFIDLEIQKIDKFLEKNSGNYSKNED